MLVRNVFGWTMALLATLVFGLGAILTSWVPPRGRLYCRWARGWARTVLFFAGISVRVEVAETSERLKNAIYMPNHESAIDILVLFLAIPHDVRFLAKRSLFYVPFLGWSMWLAGFVPVDRDRKEQAREVLSDLERRLAAGTSILVFPEGTRSRSGTLGPFKKSGFLVALKTGTPVVPVGIAGAREVMGASGLRFRPGLVTVRVGEPVSTASLGVSHRGDLMEKVRAEILKLAQAREPGGV